MSAANDLFPEPSACLYTQYYCEENVWHLCDNIRRHSPDRLDGSWVIFVSNSSKAIPLWCQKAGDQENDGFVCWDYHVFMINKHENNSIVFDLDTTLPFPCLFEQYFNLAIKDDLVLRIMDKYIRIFRVIPAQSYLELFSSDRSHMLTSDGRWLQSPPKWPPILSTDGKSSLSEFWEMNKCSDERIEASSSIMSTRDLRDNFMPNRNNANKV